MVRLEADEKVGVIGANGAGKTTLFRLAAGTEPPDSGSVLVTPGARIGVLAQRPDLDVVIQGNRIGAQTLDLNQPWASIAARLEEVLDWLHPVPEAVAS